MTSSKSGTKNQKTIKMVRIIAENVSEDTLKKYYVEYVSRGNDYDDSDSCEVCNMPKLFHIDNRGTIILGPCDKYTSSDYMKKKV